MTFLCANGHPLKEGQRFCAVCGAGVFAGERAPEKRKRFLPIAIVAGTIILALAVVGGVTGKTNTAAPGSARTTSVESVPSTPPPTTQASVAPKTTPTPTYMAAPKPAVSVKKATPTPTPTAKKTVRSPTGVNGNPWGYNFTCCNVIYNPPSSFCSYFNCIASFWDGSGYVAECNDSTYSQSGGRSGACSHHSGVNRPLYAR
jgi:hypothetical protein